MSRLTIGRITPRGPAGNIPAGGPRARTSTPSPIYRDKKRYAGSVAGMRGQRPYSVSTSNIPKGPTRSFPSVQLGRRMTTSTTTRPAARTSLLNRVIGRARTIFGR